MDDLIQINEFKRTLANAGIERSADEIFNAVNRLFQRGIVSPTLKQFLVELMGEDGYKVWWYKI